MEISTNEPLNMLSHGSYKSELSKKGSDLVFIIPGCVLKTTHGFK